MRILFVVDLAYPDHAGGSHRLYYEVAKRLVQGGHEVHLITAKVQETPAIPDREIIEGIHYHRLTRDRRNLVTHALSYIRGARNIFERLTAEAPFDVISAHYTLTTLGILLSSRHRGTPIVYTFHGPWAGEFGIELEREAQDLSAISRIRWAAWTVPSLALMRRLERIVLSSSVKVHVLSDYMGQIVTQEYGVPFSRLALIPGGVDTDKFAPAEHKSEVRRRLGLPLDRPLLLTVRRLYARMGLENLVQAMRIVVQQQAGVLLLIGGMGPLRERLQALIEQLGLTDNVRLLGHVADEQLPLYYQAADLFILPSLDLEGFGLVTLEALACGTPVLGTPVGGTIEILSTLDPCLLFASSQPEDMAKGVLEYLSTPTISSKRCRRYVLEHYTWDDMVARLEALFAAAIAEA